MPKLAVLGQPISHSRSPAMHSAALAELGLEGEWSYEAIEVAPEDFEQLVRSLPGRGFAGVNVTVPHKLAALAVADRASDAAREIGAANTLSFAGGRIAAENTDTDGLLNALPDPPAGKRALVLGAGGSARAAVWALRNAGAEVTIWNRTQAKAAALAEEFGVEAASSGEATMQSGDFDLLVNCTTVGMKEASQPPQASTDLKPLPLDADALKATNVVVDLAYGPHPTPLIRLARERGAVTVDGLEVLVHQGATALQMWTGAEPSLGVMRQAARAPS